MDRVLNAISILFVTCLVCSFSNLAIAGGAVRTDVRIIHASQGQNHIDPDLTDLAEELGSIFKYTSYRLIKAKNMHLNQSQKGIVRLPGKRSLVVAPVRIGKEKIKYKIGIFKTGEQIFSTQILLKNRRSITIGGPKFKNGYLLFNISGKIL
jgi:hypothetical protein